MLSRCSTHGCASGMDVGCGDKIISGEIPIKSGAKIQKFNKKSVAFDDGSTLDADVIILAYVRAH